MPMKKCPKCGHQNTEDAKFCSQCGTPLPLPLPRKTKATPPPLPHLAAKADNPPVADPPEVTGGFEEPDFGMPETPERNNTARLGVIATIAGIAALIVLLASLYKCSHKIPDTIADSVCIDSAVTEEIIIPEETHIDNTDFSDDSAAAPAIEIPAYDNTYTYADSVSRPDVIKPSPAVKNTGPDGPAWIGGSWEAGSMRFVINRASRTVSTYMNGELLNTSKYTYSDNTISIAAGGYLRVDESDKTLYTASGDRLH